MQKILVIDDEESTRKLLRLTLESDGYEVLTAEDGFSGLRIFEASEPKIVLTDIKMPGMDGIEVLRRLKEKNPDVEVIVITGHGEMELAIKALQFEASDFINKPITDQALSVALRRAKEKIWMREKLKEYMNNLECMLREATQEIKKRHDFEHRLIHTSMDGIIANDRKGHIIIFNEGASRIYGYTHEEATCYVNVAQLYPPGEAKAIKKKILGPDFGGAGRLINYETLALTKDGRLVPILLSATVIYEDKKEVATVGYFKDLTEIKKLQQELLQKTRMAAIGEAMTEIAHSVKNILYGMKLGAFMLERGVNKNDMAMADKGWKMVGKNIERISHLSLDMLRYARKDPDDQRRFFSLNEIVHDVCDSIRAQAESRGIVLERELSCDLPALHGYPERMHTAVMNLVTNALEAFPENRKEARITVRTGTTESNEVYLEVEDTGKGMSLELLEQIFKPLFTTKRARGTGLGLSITQKIVEEHGGTIGVRSKPNHGSTFTVRIPVTKRSQNQANLETKRL